MSVPIVAHAMDGVVLEIDSDIEEVPKDAFTIELERQLRQEDEAGIEDNDAERLRREMDKYPPLPDPADSASGERAKAAAQLRQQAEKEAAAALAGSDLQKAIDVYTLAMRTGGATAMMLANRAALLLKQRRPCAAIRDCTAALKINASMAKAYRIRAIAHRKLGHWRKAHSDVTEAQALKYDAGTAEMQRFLSSQLAKLDGGKRKSDSTATQTKETGAVETRPSVPSGAQAAVPAAALPDLDKGQAVVISGLQKAPDLNGKRGVVQRADPRPASKGRWEVEVRLPGGLFEIKSLKRENISTLNRADRAACKAWAVEEKRHKEERRVREEREEMNKYKKCVEAKMAKMPISESMQNVLRKLKPQDALNVLDKVDSKVSNVNEFLNTQVNLLTEQSDSDDEPEVKRARDG